MPKFIHPSAVINCSAEIGDDVTVGPNCFIGPEVEIGPKVDIGASVVIDGYTKIGEGCRIFHHAVIGTEPQDLKFKGEKTYVNIGRNTLIREFVTINRGTKSDSSGITNIGDECFLMAYVHIAHDCQLDNNVIMANGVNLAGHVHIAEHAIIGGLSAVHQFVSIGEYAFIGGYSAINMDIPPYASAVGNRAYIYGINTIGLNRNGFSPESIAIIKKAYRYIFSSDMNTSQAIEAIEKNIPHTPEIQKILTFIHASKRGILKRKTNINNI